MRNKYKNVKRGGFDSKREYRRYNELCILQKANVISELQCQFSFELLEGFTLNNHHECKKQTSDKVRPINYIADFVYQENGFYIVEDSKGALTDTYKLKRKLFLRKYGEYFVFLET
jgi:hypothetical protein